MAIVNKSMNVSEDGIPVAVGGGNYDFEWFDAAMTTIAGPGAGNSVASLAAGVYFVQARD